MKFMKKGTIQTDNEEKAKYNTYTKESMTLKSFAKKGKGTLPVLLATALCLSLPLGISGSEGDAGKESEITGAALESDRQAETKELEGDYAGIYHVPGKKASVLRIGESRGEEGYPVQFNIYRRIVLDFDAKEEDGALKGSVILENEEKALIEVGIEIQKNTEHKASSLEEGEDPIVMLARITKSNWEYLQEGEEFSFTPGAVPPPDYVFPYLFNEVCTGYEGTAGASLKEAAAAEAILENAIYYQLSLQDREELVEAIRLAAKEAPASLDENLEVIFGRVEEALEDFDSIRGLFEDAGVLELMESQVLSPFAGEDFQAFKEAYAQAKQAS